MHDLIYERAAPDILDPEFAPEAGEWLRTITSKDRDFFASYEQPIKKTDGDRFTEKSFKRLVSDVVGEADGEKCFDTLLQAGLIKVVKNTEPDLARYRPTCRINRVGTGHPPEQGSVFICTDSPIVDQRARVFSWPDEGKELSKLIFRHWTKHPPAKVLDMCSGAGTVGLILAKAWPGTELDWLDNSERALKYAAFNAPLNGIGTFGVKRFDLLKDPDLSGELGQKTYDIVAIDPPFTPMPQALDGYDHSSTRNVTGAALRAAVDQVKSGGMIAMLTYAFGEEDSRIPTTLQKIFDSADLSDFEDPIITPIHGPVWRVEGSKQIPLNPMPVRYMSVRYLDKDWQHQFESKGVNLADYAMWIEDEFIKKGHSHLHYVSVVLHRR